MVADDERRTQLRRLDDILEALEQLNLHDQTELPPRLEQRLVETGVDTPRQYTITQLIEKVWEVQQPYLVTVVVERRRRRRRKAEAPASARTSV